MIISKVLEIIPFVNFHFLKMLRLKNSVQNCLREISPISLIIFSIITIGALFVRFWGLSNFDFNDDEIWHLVVANQDSLWDVIQYNFREEVHPPLSYIIWHYMLEISRNDLWLRMSSVIPGILLIPSAYIFGRAYIGKAAGYFLAFLFAFGSVPIATSTTIRAYSLLMLALIWAAIFIHRYRFGDAAKRDKSLIGYFVATIVAVELSHSAALTILSLGLLLFVQTLQEKNKRDFILVSVIHGILGILVVGYALVVTRIYGFSGVIPGFYASFSDPIYYPTTYMQLFFWFPIGSEIKDFFAGIFSLIAVLTLFVTPIALIRARKWALLQLVYLPFAVVIVTDYYRVYPFSPSPRNNLFLLFSVLVSYAYFAQILFNLMQRLWTPSCDGVTNESKLSDSESKLSDSELSPRRMKGSIIGFVQNESFKNFLKIFATLIATIFFTIYVISHDSFRKTWPSCVEFTITKPDMEMVNAMLASKNTSSNVFVTAVKNSWYFRYKYGNKGHIKVLTDHLAKFESEEITLYLTAFPAREYSTNVDMLEYKLFFTDLFAELKSQGRLNEIKSFTFFDLGLGIDYLTMRFHPDLIPHKQIPFPAFEDKMYYTYWQEGYNVGWAIHSSKEVLDKFYFRDTSFSRGREILIFSFTPKFAKEEFIDKEFINGRAFEKERRGL